MLNKLFEQQQQLQKQIVQMQQNQQRTRFTTREEVTCYKCGGKGHVATVCATRESNPGYQRTIPVKSLAVKKSAKAKTKEEKAPPAAAEPSESLGDEENYSRFDTDTTTASNTLPVAPQKNTRKLNNGRELEPVVINGRQNILPINPFSVLNYSFKPTCSPELAQRAGEQVVPNSHSVSLGDSATFLVKILSTSFISNKELVTLAKVAGTVQVPVLLDTGAQANIMDLKMALSLNLLLQNLPSPIEAHFVNGTKYQMSQMVETTVRFGTNLESQQKFLLAPVGDQIILGLPWFGTGKITLDMSMNTIQFQSLTAPFSNHSIPMMTPRQLAERRLAARKKAVLKKKTGISQQRKSRTSIFLTTTQEFNRYRKSAKVFYKKKSSMKTIK